MTANMTPQQAMAFCVKRLGIDKSAYAPPPPASGMGGMPPMDPAMMGGMPPAGGMPPMDPSMMGGMPPAMPPGMPPMDPAMMGGMPPAMSPGMPPVDPMAAAMAGAVPPMPPPEMGGMPPDMGGMVMLNLEDLRTAVREAVAEAMGKPEAAEKGEPEKDEEIGEPGSTEDRLSVLEDMMSEIAMAIGLPVPDQAAAAAPQEMVPPVPEEAAMGVPPGMEFPAGVVPSEELPALPPPGMEGFTEEAMKTASLMDAVFPKQISAGNRKLLETLSQLNRYSRG